jgi:N6-adenosine-specific RNA methylase IME4
MEAEIVKRYRTITADPPWEERGGGKIKRGADRHYPLMSVDEIVEVLRDVLFFQVEPNAHLYLWVTNTFLAEGIDVMRRIGFDYMSNVVWAKSQYGLGRYFRGQHEIALFGTMGRGWDVVTDRRDIPSVIHADHRRKEGGTRVHSGKPDAFFDLVEARSKGPYLEVFARSGREGWDAWGNQAPGMPELERLADPTAKAIRELRLQLEDAKQLTLGGDES